ncbi:MAG: discoidin domain-containing protein [Planctomycetaceae bacterium]|nr:discoidin domain-containing protein [Planctomycetaceae bacterium]
MKNHWTKISFVFSVTLLFVIGNLSTNHFLFNHLLAQTEPSRTVRVIATPSSEAKSYQGFFAMDGNAKTFWHTESAKGKIAKPPHELLIDLTAEFEIRGFSIISRQDTSWNGAIDKYEIYLGVDSQNLPRVFQGRLKKTRNPQKLIFDAPIKGRYFKLRSLSEINGKNWASIAELELICDDVRFTAKPLTTLDVLSETLGKSFNPENELAQQYAFLTDNLKERSRFETIANEVYQRDSMILPEDRDPADIVLRRTAALLDDLRQLPDAPDLSAQDKKLKQLAEEVKTIETNDAVKRYDVYEKICKLRRQIAFTNPLLKFNEILFVKRHRAAFNHMCDQYYGINSVSGGGVFILLEPFGNSPKVRNLLEHSIVENGRLKGKKLENGAFVTPDISFDGKRVAFALVECNGDKKQRIHTDVSKGHWDVGDSHHIFTVNIDGSSLRQLTDGTWNDFDPCWLPNGRIAFITERRGGYLRCGRECPTYTLFDMNDDGTMMRCLSYHETNEWNPSVTHDGRILYTRWDYIDRHGSAAHMPWITTLDGRDARAVHGNFSPRNERADMELDCRVVPNSPLQIATAAPHHGQAYGSFILIDPRVEDDDCMAPVKRITPDVAFPETQGGYQVYGSPYPLSEKYYLAVADFTMANEPGAQAQQYVRGDYGIYLIDAFGNKELIYRDAEIGSMSPIPIQSRPIPPVSAIIASNVTENQPYVDPQKEKNLTATVSVLNAYESLFPLPEKTEIKEIRILQMIPMSVPSGKPSHDIGKREPTSPNSVVIPRYVLGTVPVEADGSAHFIAPAHRELVFQAIDQNGLAVQSMRSAAYFQANENMTCDGCHEQKRHTPVTLNKMPLAMKRAPSKITPIDFPGVNPFSYPQLVQPVLDKNCIACHENNADTSPNLAKMPIQNKWYASYNSLIKDYAFYSYGNALRTYPGKFGAYASKLYPILKDGHYDVKLTEEEMRRITLWLDCCSIFYGVYEKDGGETQLLGGVAYPTLE